MASKVRLFAHGQVVNAPKAPQGASNDGIVMLSQPYLARAEIDADTGTAYNTAAALAPAAARILLMQIQDGTKVHVRVTTTGTTLEADTSDPLFSGDCLFQWGPGYTLSVLQATIT